MCDNTILHVPWHARTHLDYSLWFVFFFFSCVLMNSKVINVVFQDICGYWLVVGPSRFKFNSLLNFGGNYIYRNENQSITFQNICAKHVKKLITSTMAGLPLMLLTHVMILAISAYARCRQNTASTPLGINLPFFQKDSNLELVVNMIFQLTMGIHAVIGCLGLEIGECLFNNTIKAIPDVIRFNLAQLNDEYEANGMNLKSIFQLRNTFQLIQDYQRYVGSATICLLLVSIKTMIHESHELFMPCETNWSPLWSIK